MDNKIIEEIANSFESWDMMYERLEKNNFIPSPNDDVIGLQWLLDYLIETGQFEKGIKINELIVKENSSKTN